MALLACVCSHTHLFAGLTNRSLRELIAGLIPGYTARQMTHDLRRLRRKGFIQRIPHTQRYQLTSDGYRLAVFFTKTYTRILNPTLADLDPTLPRRDREPQPNRQSPARLRTPTRRPNRRRRPHILKDDSTVNFSGT